MRTETKISITAIILIPTVLAWLLVTEQKRSEKAIHEMYKRELLRDINEKIESQDRMNSEARYFLTSPIRNYNSAEGNAYISDKLMTGTKALDSLRYARQKQEAFLDSLRQNVKQ